MKPFFSFTIVLMLSFLSTNVADSADIGSANKLYTESGLEKQMADIGPALFAGYENNYRRSKSHSTRDKMIHRNIEPMIEDSFVAATMRESIVDSVVQKIAEPDMEEILAWLSSPVGSRITSLEKMAGTPKGIAETQQFIKKLKKGDLPKERALLIKELDSSLNITETSAAVTLCTQFALSMTTRQTKNKFSHQNIQKRYSDFQKKRTQIESMMRQQVQGSLLYTYQSLSDKELTQYVAFAKSDSGQTYSTITSASMLQAICSSSLELAWQISQL